MQIAQALARVERMLPQFDPWFPAPSSESNIYAPIDNVEWTNGFWTGMVWLAWNSPATRYRDLGERHVASFAQRARAYQHRPS
jgi:unsaturated chondroitin disaccharide hydrolase